MSNARQKAAQQAETRRQEAQEALATKEEAVAEVPAFVEEAKVESEVVKKTDEDLTKSYKATVETQENHIQTEKAKNAPSQKVDIAKLRTQLSSSGNFVLETILKYMEDMKPGIPMQETIGARHQAALWGAINTLFNRLDDKDFTILYRAVLDLFNEHKDGVFADDKVYRFAEYWTMSESDRAAFRRLLNLMLVTRDAKSRKESVKQLKDWTYILEYGLTEKGRNRIRNFYEL